jgi:hypothetical protein
MYVMMTKGIEGATLIYNRMCSVCERDRASARERQCLATEVACS